MPIIPFLALAGGVGWLAFKSGKKNAATADRAVVEAAMEEAQAQRRWPEEAPISDRLTIDVLRLELGYGLLPLIKEDDTGADRLTDQIKALRRQLAHGNGLRHAAGAHPGQHAARPNDYTVKIKEIDAGRGEIFARPAAWSWIPRASEINLPGEHTTEPTFGLPATWIEPALREEAAPRLHRGRSRRPCSPRT